MATVDQLIEALGGDGEGVTVVFTDGVTEYTYGVQIVHAGPDHILLTYDVDQQYFPPDPTHVLQEAE